MKKTFSLCISGLLLIGGLNANPFNTVNKSNFGLNSNKNHQVNVLNAFAPKKSKGGVFQEGDMIIAVGYGFPNMGKTLLKAVTGVNNFKASGFGPLHFRFEYALSEAWGIGLSSNFNKYGWSDDYTGTVYNSVTGVYDNVIYHESYNVTAVNFLIRFNKHWAAGDKADIFSGFGLGYSMRNGKYVTNNPSSTGYSGKNLVPVGFEWTVGCRIFFTDNLGAYVEAGYAKDVIQVGLCYKIGN